MKEIKRELYYYKICAAVKTKIMAAHHCRPYSIMTHEPQKRYNTASRSLNSDL